ncbi:hypothetical protein BDV97DRAFT_397108 [Delphinella strobiligena]|nr:hypothetical protein BDV97DRAFT_397108 [Delphinella strobiligena]
MKKIWPEKNADAGIQFHPALGYDNLRRDSPIFDLSRFRSHMFGDERNVILTLSKYLNIVEAEVTPLPIGGQSQRFLALEAFLQQRVKACACFSCFHRPEDYDEDSPVGLKPHTPGSLTNLASLAASITGKGTQSYNLDSECALMRLWAQIAVFTAEILALSLYNCTEALRVFWPGEGAALARAQGKFARSVYQCTFVSCRPEFCLISDVLQFATSLIGHELTSDLKSGTWIASASRGQVIYPLLFEFPALMARPLLLGGGPGQLFFQGSKFDRVVSQTRASTGAPNVPRDVITVVDRLLSLYPNGKGKLEWHVNLAARDPELFFGTSRCQGTYNPHDVLLTIIRSLFVRCEHPEDTVMPSPAADCVFTTSLFFGNWEHTRRYDSEVGMYKYIHMRTLQDESGDRPFKIQVIPTTGNDGLRLFAMLSPIPGIIRDRACIQCCIDVCRKSGLEYIVL